jgi:hypothetical protein
VLRCGTSWCLISGCYLFCAFPHLLGQDTMSLDNWFSVFQDHGCLKMLEANYTAIWHHIPEKWLSQTHFSYAQIMLFVIILFMNVFCPTAHKFSKYIRTKCLLLGLQPFLNCFCPPLLYISNAVLLLKSQKLDHALLLFFAAFYHSSRPLNSTCLVLADTPSYLDAQFHCLL